MFITIAGIIFVLVGVGLLIAEFHTPGLGLLLVFGIISMIAGIVLLIEGGPAVFEVNWWVISILIILVLAAAAYAIWRVILTYRRQAATGKEDIIGKKGQVKETLNPEGVVSFQGELWTAVSESGVVQPGEEVVITKVEGLKLSVKKITKE
jgi:membrane-bound serine protease (ClpP class)